MNTSAGQTTHLVTAALGHAAFSGGQASCKTEDTEEQGRKLAHVGSWLPREKARTGLFSFSFQAHQSNTPLHLL